MKSLWGSAPWALTPAWQPTQRQTVLRLSRSGRVSNALIWDIKEWSCRLSWCLNQMCFFHQMWSSDGSSELAGAFPSNLKGAWGALHPSQRGLESPGAPLWTPMWKRGIKGLQREEVLSYLTAADFLPTQIWQFNGTRHTLSPATKLPKIQQQPEVGGRQGSQRKPRLFREPCRAGCG